MSIDKQDFHIIISVILAEKMDKIDMMVAGGGITTFRPIALSYERFFLELTLLKSQENVTSVGALTECPSGLSTRMLRQPDFLPTDFFYSSDNLSPTPPQWRWTYCHIKFDILSRRLIMSQC